MISPDLNRVAELANRLAERTLEALEHGRLTTEEFRESPDVALIFEAAKLLQAAGAEFPAGIVRLAQKAGEQTQILWACDAKQGEPIAGVAAELRKHPALQMHKARLTGRAVCFRAGRRSTHGPAEASGRSEAVQGSERRPSSAPFAYC